MKKKKSKYHKDRELTRGGGGGKEGRDERGVAEGSNVTRQGNIFNCHRRTSCH